MLFCNCFHQRTNLTTTQKQWITTVNFYNWLWCCIGNIFLAIPDHGLNSGIFIQGSIQHSVISPFFSHISKEMCTFPCHLFVWIPLWCLAEARSSFCCFFPLPNVSKTMLSKDWQMLTVESKMHLLSWCKPVCQKLERLSESLLCGLLAVTYVLHGQKYTFESETKI